MVTSGLSDAKIAEKNAARDHAWFERVSPFFCPALTYILYHFYV